MQPVEDTFSISGRGTVATGRIEQGVLKTGDELEIVGLVNTVKSTCTGNLYLFNSLSVVINQYYYIN